MKKQTLVQIVFFSLFLSAAYTPELFGWPMHQTIRLGKRATFISAEGHKAIVHTASDYRSGDLFDLGVVVRPGPSKAKLDPLRAGVRVLGGGAREARQRPFRFGIDAPDEEGQLPPPKGGGL